VFVDLPEWEVDVLIDQWNDEQRELEKSRRRR
jgi:hypothetical protein